MNKEYRLTRAGIEELEAELTSLKDKRRSVAERLKTAREFGDLSENAEYHAAREEQAQMEARIAEIEQILKNVVTIEEKTSNGHVRLGSVLEVHVGGKTKKTIHIVGSVEADPLQDKVSDESPIGQALLGKKVGESVEIPTSNGPVRYTINAIN